MSDFSVLDCSRVAHIGEGVGNNYGTAVVADSVIHTKGAYVDLTTSTPFASSSFVLNILRGSLNGVSFLIDIAIGSGVKTVIIPNVPFSTRANFTNSISIRLPFMIPKGIQVSARCQCSTASASVFLSMHLLSSGFPRDHTFGVAEAYGVSLATSSNTFIDPLGVVNTKGAYIELVAATTNKISWICFLIDGGVDATRVDTNWKVDIAIGPPVEQPIITDYILSADSTGDMVYPNQLSMAYSIPVGTRIAVRAKCTISDANNRLFKMSMIGVG